VFGLFLAFVAGLPAYLATFPAMTDYPSHLARYEIMLFREARPFLAQYYNFQWLWVGNLGVDILMLPLGRLMGVEAAGRLVVMALPVLCGLGIVAVEWALRRRVTVATAIAAALIWQPAMAFGFLNYMLSLGLALLAFAAWVELRDWRLRRAVMVPVGVIVYLAHVSGWGVLGIMVFGYEWHRSKTWRAFVAPWPLALPLLFFLGTGGSGRGGLPSYGTAPLLFKQTLWVRAMRDQIEWLDIASISIVGVALFTALMLRRLDWRLSWGALFMLAGSLAMPRHIFGGDYADYRLIGSGLIAAALAVAWRAPRWVFYLAPALFLGRLAVTAQAWTEQSRETAEEVAGLALVPPGARIANVVGITRGRWAFNPWEHICGYAVIRNDALSNCNFALPGVHMISLRGPRPHWNDPSQRLFVSKDHILDLTDYGPVRDMDWLWYVGEVPVMLPPGTEVVYATRHSLIARLAGRKPVR
jgi:hypothetical protein